jgi:hypothetical protein
MIAPTGRRLARQLRGMPQSQTSGTSGHITRKARTASRAFSIARSLRTSSDWYEIHIQSKTRDRRIPDWYAGHFRAGQRLWEHKPIKGTR